MRKLVKPIIVFYVLFIPLVSMGNLKITPSEDVVTVHIYRPKKLVGFAWVFNLKVNGERYDRIKNGDHLVLQFKPGRTTFGIKKKKLSLNLEAGKTYYIRTFIAAGVYIGSLDLIEVTESFAKTELKKSS
ncbi:DUF2846 domain-containing protein [uncultured Croceitalea sp.]|uniref:DUF2846 domain-containing protein n=1 Tax=uncultured Croceitalea sp. TaxID=1798908 RepID=UPI003305DBCD